MDDVTRLAELFRRTGEAHHEAFIETDGDDPEWPLWYAEHILDDLETLVGTDLTRSEVTHLIMGAEERRAEEAPDADWAELYARHVLDRLG